MKIFLSYPIQSHLEAERLAAELQQAGIDVWLYTQKVPASSNFEESQVLIQQGIENADVLLVLVSSFTRKSPGVQREIIYAQHRNLPILPVVIEPLDPVKLLPLNLLDTEYIDLFGKNTVELVRYLRERFPKTEKAPVSEEELTQDRERILTDEKVSRVFIAYSRHQRPIAKELTELLIRNGHAVFWDAKIKAGATWRQTIQKALDDATHVVVIWTPEAAHSDEVEREVSYALAERKVIVPLLSKEIPKLPYHLHGLHYLILPDDLKSIESELVQAIALHAQDDDLWE